MQRRIRTGAIKLNVNKLLLEVWNEILRKNASSWSIPKLMDEQIRFIQAETERWMGICGSSGKAPEKASRDHRATLIRHHIEARQEITTKGNIFSEARAQNSLSNHRFKN